jgi:tripartite-type tricarboxylate transporter receptor subunit TctC
LAARIATRLGQPIVVKNRSGATGAIGTEAVIQSKPDDYTLLTGSPGSIVNGPLLVAAPRYDTMKDLTPIALLEQVSVVIIVRSEISVRNLAELIAYSKTKRAGVMVGICSVGGANCLSLDSSRRRQGLTLCMCPIAVAATPCRTLPRETWMAS